MSQGLHSMLTAADSWGNVHQNWRQVIKGLYLPENPASGDDYERHRDSSRLIRDAIRAAIDGEDRIRGLGGRWSFSTVAATNGYQVDNTELASILPPFQDWVRAEHPDPGNLVLVQAGIRIARLNAELAARGKSLHTSGASDGQTMAGALSTGTHGAALQFGSVPDFVIGLHLGTGEARSVWIERESAPVASPELLARLDADLIADDEIFNCALVSFGSFGVILAMMLEVRNSFALWEQRESHAVDAALRNALATGDVSGLRHSSSGVRPHHFDAVVNPYSQGAQDQALVTIMHEIPASDCSAVAQPNGSSSLQGIAADVLQFLESLGLGFVLPPVVSDPLEWLTHNFDWLDGELGEHVMDGLLPHMIELVLSQRYRTPFSNCGPHGKIFGPADVRGKIASTAIGVSSADAPRLLDLVLRLHPQGSFGGILNPGRSIPGALGNRLVKGTSATLGLARFPLTHVLEIDGIDCTRMRRFYRRVWKALEDEGIEHTIHWGKMYEWSPARMSDRCTADRLNTWLDARREVLRTPAQRASFQNDFLDAAGIHP